MKGPAEQSPYSLHLLGPFLARVELPASPPDMPGPFRFAQSGTLGDELRRAGFSAVEEQLQIVPMPWAGPPEEVWLNFYDVARPVRPLIDGLDAEERDAAVGEVLAGLRSYHDGTHTSPPGAFVIASGPRE